ncbi:hypothetical protein MILUP08_41163 [Micromonospora lupini str. Lupac 08]|uniref:Uncharacterized protein n=1 Tax=Micromonospora lupini str. Lupac 08 TaxID=1150864 RepID=I0KXF2_9ACTN|nr:hypothetical protein MILUP08_41163 [Micromonospora lupini str. Lupac 08]
MATNPSTSTRCSTASPTSCTNRAANSASPRPRTTASRTPCAPGRPTRRDFGTTGHTRRIYQDIRMRDLLDGVRRQWLSLA